MSEDVLQRAVELYRQGKTEQAAGLLSALVEREPKNASAWYGLAVCLKDTAQKRYCLQRTLSLNPEHAQARQMQEQLTAGINPLAASANRESVQSRENPKPSYGEPLRKELGLTSARVAVQKPPSWRKRWILLASGGVILLAMIAASCYGFNRLSQAFPRLVTPTPTRTSLISFPPTWTSAPTRTMQPYPTLKPSFTPLPSNTVVYMINLTPSISETLQPARTSPVPKASATKTARTLKPTKTPTP
jgi:hypothetical protein